MKLRWYYKLLLSVLSAVLLSAGWTDFGLGPLVFLGLVPLLIIAESMSVRNNASNTNMFLWSFIAFLLWNAITTWWIYHSTLFGAIAAIVCSALLMAMVFDMGCRISRKMGTPQSYMALISFWLSFEFLFMNSQISWPWLILGNAFANNISLVQWYEFTGHLGGSLWVLVINVLLFRLLMAFMNTLGRQKIIRFSLITTLVLVIPITFSIIRYYTYSEEINPVDVLVFQPNIDPYNEKFTTPAIDQLTDMLHLIESKMDDKVDFIVGPETAIPTGFWEDDVDNESSLLYLRSFLDLYPNASMIIGANTRIYYENGNGKTKTAMRLGNTAHWYDLFNTGVFIDTSPRVQIYHKSKLVPGVEMMPYPEVLGFLGEMAVDLGGMQGSHGTQLHRTPMMRVADSLQVGTAICYESAYGEFFSEFVRNGAGFMCIITNDGWWSNTPGHRQHKSFASLRAIETRRSIARSANTGISCFVNQRGDILQPTKWWTTDVIRAQININHRLTFYTRYGDYLARMSLVLSAVLILMSISRWIMKITRRKSTTIS